MERKTNKVENVKIVLGHRDEDSSVEWQWDGTEKKTHIHIMLIKKKTEKIM